MTDIRTLRLLLHAIDVAEGIRIVRRNAGPADVWANGFPFEGDIGAVGAFLRATAEWGEAAEAVVALLTVAAGQGVSKVVADTALDNIASQRTLIRAGFHLVRTDGEFHYYETLLGMG